MLSITYHLKSTNVFTSRYSKLMLRNTRCKNTKKKDSDKERHRKTANTRKKKENCCHIRFSASVNGPSKFYNSMRKYILRCHQKRKFCHYKKEMLSILAPSSDNVKETLLLSLAVKIKMPEVEQFLCKTFIK